MNDGWRLGLALATACGAAAPPSALSNRGGSERDAPVAMTLTIYVEDTRTSCDHGTRDHVEVAIDGRPVGSIKVNCYDARRVSAQTRRFRLHDAPVVEQGRHRIAVRHIESGLAATRDLPLDTGRPQDRSEPWIMHDKLRITLDDARLVIGDLGID